jgi:hypothetical protein
MGHGIRWTRLYQPRAWSRSSRSLWSPDGSGGISLGVRSSHVPGFAALGVRPELRDLSADGK